MANYDQAMAELRMGRDRPELGIPAPRIAGRMDFSRTSLSSKRRLQLHRIAQAWGIQVKADGTKEEILPALIAAEEAGVFTRQPQRRFLAWLSQFRQDEPLPPYHPDDFPGDPDLADFQTKQVAPAPAVAPPTSSLAADRGPGAVEPPAPISMEEIERRIETKARELADKMRKADATALMETLAREGALDLNKVMDRYDPNMKSVVGKRMKAIRQADPELKELRAKAKALGINTFAMGKTKISDALKAKEQGDGERTNP